MEERQYVGFWMKKNYKGEGFKIVQTEFSTLSWAREELLGRQRRDCMLAIG